MAGMELADLPLDRALNVITALAVDDATPAVIVETKKGIETYDRRRVRRDVLAQLHGEATGGVRTQAGRAPARAKQVTSRTWDPATWGLLPEHQAAQRRAMGFAAGLG